MNASRYVEREHLCAMRVDGLHGTREFAAYVALKAAAQDGVDEQRSLVIELPFPWQHHAAFGDEFAVSRRRVARESGRVG